MNKYALICLFSSLNISAVDITTTQAINYVGKVKTVCGKVASTYYAQNSYGGPTFFNLDKPYPNQDFTAIVFEDNRYKFTVAPEIYYNNKKVCINGLIKYNNGVTQIDIQEVSQIRIK